MKILKVVLFIVGYIFLFLMVVYLLVVRKIPVKTSLSEKYPYIRHAISCKGENEDEYKKRQASNNPFQDREIYMETYKNKWDTQSDKQQFNILYETENPGWVQKYPAINKSGVANLYGIAKKVRLDNFMEKLDIRLNQYSVSGKGYYFYNDGADLILSSSYDFTSDAAKKNEACFDDKKRRMIMNINDKTQVRIGPTANELNFSVFTPQYCSAHAYFNPNGDIFLICLAEKTSAEEGKFLILGYSKNSDSNYTLPVLMETFNDRFPDNYITDWNFDRTTIIKNQTGQYYLFTNTQVYEIKRDSEGYLRMSKIDYPAPYGLIRPTIPNEYTTEPYTLPYVFIERQADSNPGGLVFDISQGKFLEVDYGSCVAAAPDSFFNRTVDPFVEGPYRSLDFRILSANHVRVKQVSYSASTLTEEGVIDVYFDKDSINCNIKIDGTQHY